MSASILVIQPISDAGQGLIEALLAGGYSLGAVASLGMAEAMTAQLGDFDLVILDVDLPNADGRAFCARLRRRGLDTPVIVLSACAQEDDVVRGFAAGADDFLAKPVSLPELKARIAGQLRRAGPRRKTPGAVP